MTWLTMMVVLQPFKDSVSEPLIVADSCWLGDRGDSCLTHFLISKMGFNRGHNFVNNIHVETFRQALFFRILYKYHLKYRGYKVINIRLSLLPSLVVSLSVPYPPRSPQLSSILISEPHPNHIHPNPHPNEYVDYAFDAKYTQCTYKRTLNVPKFPTRDQN